MVSKRLAVEGLLFQPWLLKEFPDIAHAIKAIPKNEVLQFFQELDQAMKEGIRFTFPGDSDYPVTFYRMQEPPFFLNYLGKPSWKTGVCFSVVGSRDPSLNGYQWMEIYLPEVFRQLQVLDQSIILVSGGARGVDQIGHSLAIRNKVPTCVFLPSGILKMYPKELNDFKQEVLAGQGAFVSEYRPNQNMHRGMFIQRNRLISAISVSTLVIDAGKKSGTMLTARHCADQGRQLMVVPTHPLDSKGNGGLELIREGAALVKDNFDVVDILQSEIKTFLNYESLSLQ